METQYGIVCMCMVRRCVVGQRAKHVLEGEGILLRRADLFQGGLLFEGSG